MKRDSTLTEPVEGLGLDGSSGRPRTVAVDVRYLRRRGVGIRAVVEALVDELTVAGECLVLVTDDPVAGERLRELYPKALVEVVIRTTWLWWEQVRLARLLNTLRPDVYVAPANYGIPLLHPRRIRTVLVVHDLIPLLFWRRYLRPRPVWAAMYLVATACAIGRADQIVAVSEQTAGDLRRLTRRRATVVYPPIPSRRAASFRSGPRRYVLFNGGFDERKNISVLLEAFAAFVSSPEGDGFELVVIGEGTEYLRPDLQRLGIDGRSELTGFVDEPTKWAWLEQAACVAYPSSYEGFGLVVVEGFACGIPVVTGVGGALREVGGAAVIVVDPTSATSIAEGLRAATDPEIAATMVEAGYEQLERLREQSGGYARLVASADDRSLKRMIKKVSA